MKLCTGLTFALLALQNAVDACKEEDLKHLNKDLILPKKDGFPEKKGLIGVIYRNRKYKSKIPNNCLQTMRIFHYGVNGDALTELEMEVDTSTTTIGKNFYLKNVHLHSTDDKCQNFAIDCKEITLRRTQKNWLKESKCGSTHCFEGIDTCEYRDNRQVLDLEMVKTKLIPNARENFKHVDEFDKDCRLGDWEIEFGGHEHYNKLAKVHLINQKCNFWVNCNKIDFDNDEIDCVAVEGKHIHNEGDHDHDN